MKSWVKQVINYVFTKQDLELNSDYDKGFRDGFNKAHAEARQVGFHEGFLLGHKEGFEEGQIEAKFRSARTHIIDVD